MGQAQNSARAHAAHGAPYPTPYPPHPSLTARVDCGVVGEIVACFFNGEMRNAPLSPLKSRGNRGSSFHSPVASSSSRNPRRSPPPRRSKESSAPPPAATNTTTTLWALKEDRHAGPKCTHTVNGQTWYARDDFAAWLYRQPATPDGR